VLTQYQLSKEQVCYLLLGLGAGSGVISSKEHPKVYPQKPYPILERCARDFSKFLGFPFWIAPITGKKLGANNYRFFFRFNDYKQDDEQARRICDSIIFSVSFLYCSPIYNYEGELFFRFPRQNNEDLFEYGKLVKEEERIAPPWERQFYYPISAIGSYRCFPDFIVAETLNVARVCLRHENVLQSFAFLHESAKTFYANSVDMEELLIDKDRESANVLEQNNWENSAQNAFKAIEALIGDPPKDDERFFKKLRSLGLDPDSTVGYKEKKPLFEAIRQLGVLRDKKAAHGSTPNRRIKLGEMLDCQACREKVVWLSVEYLLDRKINLEAKRK
jgi:hypothetical protein